MLITAIAGMIAIGAGLIGYWYFKLNPLLRLISLVAGIFLMYPGSYTDIIGAIIFVIMVIYQLARMKANSALK